MGLVDGRVMAGAEGREMFPSRLAPGPVERRMAVCAVVVSAAVFLAVVPFAKTPLPAVWAFVPIYESALVVSDLITAVLLFSQFAFLRAPALLVLAAGYLFTAMIAAVHGLTFPGLFSPTGLLGAGPQSTAWLFMFWHAVFPLFVVGYAWLPSEGRRLRPSLAVGGAVAATGVLVGALGLLATAGHDALPAIMQGNRYTSAMAMVVTATWAFSLAALVVLWLRRPHSILDLWLMVVMSAWLFDIALSAVLNAGRFDVGFYAGRIYGLLAANVVLVVLLSENGKLYARLVAAHEETRALHRAREKQEQRRMAAIVETSDDAIIGEDAAGLVAAWNAGAERMFGYRADEIVGRSVAVLVPSERRREDEEIHQRVRSGGVVDHVATIRRRADGQRIDVVVSVSPLRDATGDTLGLTTVVRDVSERMQTREALRQSEATVMAFIDSAAEGILIVDETGRIVVANRQVETMFRYAPRELLGQPMEVLLPERLRGGHVGYRAAYAAEPRVRPMGRGLDLAGRRRDGTEFPVEISLSYVRTAAGVRVMAFITDITERVLLERSARHSEKLAALGTLSAGIAHELNNPLGIISSRIEVMLLEGEDAPLAPGVREDLGVIHRQVQRVARLVQGLLSYARPSASARRPVDVNHAVDEMLLLAQKQLDKQGVRIATALDRSLPRIVGEHSALEQVLLNLITNAQQAIEGAGEIAITTRAAAERPGWVEVIVADSGRGMPAEEVSRIFDPYYTTKQQGTGLGLSITHRIVEEHGGTIRVESSPGHGTRFVLSFPTEAG